MVTVTSENLRHQLGGLIDRVVAHNERLAVTRRGKRVMALVPIEDLDFMEQILDALEDEMDLPVIKQRIREYERTGDAITLEEFEKELRAGG